MATTVRCGSQMSILLFEQQVTAVAPHVWVFIFGKAYQYDHIEDQENIETRHLVWWAAAGRSHTEAPF